MPKYLLLPDDPSTLTANPGWLAFLARITKSLDELDLGWYQGSYLELGSEFALGYLATRETQPALAERFAGRALGVMLSGMRAYQKARPNSYEIVGVADGAARTFRLRPNAHGLATVAYSQPGEVEVTRAAGPWDKVGGPLTLLSVSDAGGEYTRDVDWRQGDRPLDVEWLPAGRQPAVGQKYVVRYVAPTSSVLANLTIAADSTVILPVTPPAGAFVFAAYLYDEPGRPGLQTYDGLGGFRSVYSDQGYAARYLGKHIATILDWLWDFPGLRDAEKAEAVALLVRWADYYKVSGYLHGSLQSNYGLGAYCSWVFSGIVLESRVGDSRLLDEAAAFRAANLSQVATGLRGGFWPEGWSYGTLSVQNLLLPALALEARRGTDVGAERAFAADVVAHLTHADPDGTLSTVFDAGDWFQYPAPFPVHNLHPVLWAACGAPAARRLCKRAAGESYLDLLYPEFWAYAATPPGGPLSHVAAGTGVCLSRSAWQGDQVFVAVHCGPVLVADHQAYCPGQVQLWGNGEPLLVNGSVALHNQDGPPKTRYGNVVIVDCPDRGVQTYQRAMNVEYGPVGPKLTVTADGLVTRYTMDTGVAYSHRTGPGCGGPVEFMVRDAVYARPDVLVVQDRAGVRRDKAGVPYPWWVQWAVGGPAAPDPDGWWRVSRGGQTLFLRAFDDSGGDLPGKATKEVYGVHACDYLSFAFPQPTARARVVTVAVVGRKPGVVTVSADHVTVDDVTIPLDSRWPDPLPAAPVSPPASPPPPTVPERLMPDPVYTLDGQSQLPPTLSLAYGDYNGHRTLKFDAAIKLPLGERIRGAGFAAVYLYRRLPGAPRSFPLLSRDGQFVAYCYPALGGSVNQFWHADGVVSNITSGVRGDTDVFQAWGLAFAPTAHGLAAANHNGTEVTTAGGNQKSLSPLAQPDAPLVVNASGGVFELVGMDLYDTLTRAELGVAVDRLARRYATVPPVPPVPPPPPVLPPVPPVPPVPPPPPPTVLYRAKITVNGTDVEFDVALTPRPA